MGIRELKQNPSKIINQVKSGEDVFITERGVPVARITPLHVGPLDEMVASGEIAQASGSVTDLLSEIHRATAAEGEKSIAEWLRFSRGYDS